MAAVCVCAGYVLCLLFVRVEGTLYQLSTLSYSILIKLLRYIEHVPRVLLKAVGVLGM